MTLYYHTLSKVTEVSIANVTKFTKIIFPKFTGNKRLIQCLTMRDVAKKLNWRRATTAQRDPV